jgi:hypothetical protein
MPTKAELEAELAAVKKELDASRGADATTDDGTATDTEDDPDAGSGGGTGSAAIDKLLAENGIETADIRALMDAFGSELGQLPQNKPVLTALGAFGLGFVLGRMSKS